MKIVKYFYGKPTFVENVNIVTNEHGEPVCGCYNTLSKKALPRITVCGIYDSETNKISIGVSKCSSNDLFVKKVGKEIAYKRAISNPMCTMSVLPGEVISHVFFDIARTLEQRYSSLKTTSF
jgi:hypothetical protein